MCPTPAKRCRPPGRRKCTTITVHVGGQKVHMTMSEFADGTLAEVFIDMHKTGSFARTVMHSVARLFSVAVQHGVPLDLLVRMFRGIAFEPAGEVVGHEAIHGATSVLDFMVQAVAHQYLKEKR